jgi:hypothetical protein
MSQSKKSRQEDVPKIWCLHNLEKTHQIHNILYFLPGLLPHYN